MYNEAVSGIPMVGTIGNKGKSKDDLTEYKGKLRFALFYFWVISLVQPTIAYCLAFHTNGMAFTDEALIYETHNLVHHANLLRDSAIMKEQETF